MGDRNIGMRLGVWTVGITAVLLVPFLTRAPWTWTDYLFAFVVLGGVAIAYELLTEHTKSRKLRILIGVGAALFLILVQAWAATGPD